MGALWVAQRVHCSTSLKVFAWSALAGWAAIVAASRRILGVHSTSQLLVGSGLGVGTGAAWFVLEGLLRGPVLAPAQRRLDKAWAWLDIRCDGYCGDSSR